ncbi:MAG: Bax inhibitor-1/YccA family protein [Candidatus Omnitrophica bacterium]|nr:Bax inhibitor-1/YccA family protein [Candidatus Omnitrophota bacterium]
MNDQDYRPFASSHEMVFSTFMQRVYQWMAIGLTLTAFVAFMTVRNAGLMRFLFGGGMFFLVLVELGLVFWLSASLGRISPQAAVLGFLSYATLNGITMAAILFMYTAASVASTFFITAATFAGVSVYGWVTKQDLTSVGHFCGMALWGLILASVVNLFFNAPVFYWLLSYAGVAIFVGLTAYDTQYLKRIHQGMADAPEQLAVYGALKLYLDFINMFIFLLRIFGRRR